MLDLWLYNISEGSFVRKITYQTLNFLLIVYNWQLNTKFDGNLWFETKISTEVDVGFYIDLRGTKNGVTQKKSMAPEMKVLDVV